MTVSNLKILANKFSQKVFSRPKTKNASQSIRMPV